MSWRRFTVLLWGLSPVSATVAALRSEREFGKGGDVVRTMRTPEAAQHAFEALFAPAKPRGDA